MPATKKPSIVFCHGIWADGSCFNKVIPALQADGHDVIAVQYGLDTFAEDVATVKRTLGRVSSPAILVGPTAPCIPTSSVFWRNAWGRPPSRRTAATSSCSPSPTSSLT
jgi:hypothetical protein